MTDPTSADGTTSDAPPPLFRLRNVTVHVVLREQAPRTPHAPRDLPDLARFLFHTLAPEEERRRIAVDGLHLDLEAATCVGLVGEGGSGKSTLARLCARLARPSTGAVEWRGVNLHTARSEDGLSVRRAVQVLFDDPEAGLDPRCTIERSLQLALEALELERSAWVSRIERAVALSRLPNDLLTSRAESLGPGHLRLAALARALVAEPEVIVADEPTAGLDPSDRALVLETLRGLCREQGGPAILLLTRDLAAARALATRIGVLKKGKLVEMGDATRLFEAASDPYTRALIAAAPQLGVSRLLTAAEREVAKVNRA